MVDIPMENKETCQKLSKQFQIPIDLKKALSHGHFVLSTCLLKRYEVQRKDSDYLKIEKLGAIGLMQTCQQ